MCLAPNVPNKSFTRLCTKSYYVEYNSKLLYWPASWLLLLSILCLKRVFDTQPHLSQAYDFETLYAH